MISRRSDQALDCRLVSELIGSQFPQLAGQPVSWFGAGWDNELFRVGEQWILRFPKRAERVPWLLREIEIMAAAGERLGSRMPQFELFGEPGHGYAYPFVGYRMLPGVAADQVPARDQLAGDLAAVLSDLHRVDVDRIPPAPDAWEDEPPGERWQELAAVAPVARSALDQRLRLLAEPYLSGLEAEPEPGEAIRFIHNDVCADHLIVDSATGRLTGLIDFTDAMVGDPVLDFVGLIGVGGYEFIGRVVAGYELELDGPFWPRLRWLARTLTLLWLAEAVTDDPASVPKHLSLVARAFDDEGPA